MCVKVVFNNRIGNELQYFTTGNVERATKYFVKQTAGKFTPNVEQFKEIVQRKRPRCSKPVAKNLVLKKAIRGVYTIILIYIISTAF